MTDIVELKVMDIYILEYIIVLAFTVMICVMAAASVYSIVMFMVEKYDKYKEAKELREYRVASLRKIQHGKFMDIMKNLKSDMDILLASINTCEKIPDSNVLEIRSHISDAYRILNEASIESAGDEKD